MFASGELNKQQLATLRKSLAGMDLPPKKRQRLLWRLAKYGLIAAAKRNVRNQQDPDGNAWQGRKTKRKGKMLRNLPKLLHIREMPEIEAVRVYFQGGGYRNGETPVPAGVIADSQQNGMHQKRSRGGKRRIVGPEVMATPGQAKKLRALGYRVRKGKRWRKPTLGEITASMHYNQAGILIRKLSGKAVKTSWTIDLPAREFLGMSDDDFNKALARQLQAIGFGWDVNAQDIRGGA
jgi:phage gpG-like protein